MSNNVLIGIAMMHKFLFNRNIVARSFSTIYYTQGRYMIVHTFNHLIYVNLLYEARYINEGISNLWINLFCNSMAGQANSHSQFHNIYETIHL